MNNQERWDRSMASKAQAGVFSASIRMFRVPRRSRRDAVHVFAENRDCDHGFRQEIHRTGPKRASIPNSAKEQKRPGNSPVFTLARHLHDEGPESLVAGSTGPSPPSRTLSSPRSTPVAIAQVPERSAVVSARAAGAAVSMEVQVVESVVPSNRHRQARVDAPGNRALQPPKRIASGRFTFMVHVVGKAEALGSAMEPGGPRGQRSAGAAPVNVSDCRQKGMGIRLHCRSEAPCRSACFCHRRSTRLPGGKIFRNS